MSRTKGAASNGSGSAASGAAIPARKATKMQITTQKRGHESNGDADTTTAAIPPVPQRQVDTQTESHDSDSSNANKHLEGNSSARKRDRDEFASEAVEERAALPLAKKRKYKSKAEKEAVKVIQEVESGAGDRFDPAIAQMTLELLADHFAKTIKRCYKDDTELELAKRYLPGSTLTDTASFTADRKRDMLETYLEALVEGDKSKLETSTKDKASPHTLVVCSSAIRGVDLGRVLRKYETDGNKLAKLFGKHFKIEQQARFLRKTSVGFGVCTPDRIRKLIENRALRVERLARIVIDGSYVDEKGRGLWNIVEVSKPMLEMLRMDEIQERIEEGSLKVVVF